MQVAIERTNRWSAAHMPRMCGYTCHFVLSHIPQTASSGLPPAFPSPFCSLFLLWPWTVTQHLRWRKFSISNHRSGLCYKSCSFGSWEVGCLHSPEQPGALGQSPNLKEKCQTFRTVILLNDINTHSKRILLLLPLKHVLVFHTEHVRVSIQHIYFSPLNLNRWPHQLKIWRWGGSSNLQPIQNLTAEA